MYTLCTPHSEWYIYVLFSWINKAWFEKYSIVYWPHIRVYVKVTIHQTSMGV